ncbi:MAG TPA: hypothetical protein PLI05_04710 [Methanotrichaceae archaeon]|nr:hypothetical protein [Methanotrichaceae archaeon]HQI91034.1 hypothetical protein [Methanotrichaceae archaeon]
MATENKINMEPESLSIAEAISRVKAAIRSAQMKGEFDFDIDKLELTLKVLSEKDASGNFKLAIPFIDTDLGFGGKYMANGIQTITLTMVPEIKKRDFPEDLENNLVQAIEIINQGIKQASNEPPNFRLQEASIELDFVVDKRGEVALMAKGGIRSEITNVIKLYLKSNV